jgi:hypothetical protein
VRFHRDDRAGAGSPEKTSAGNAVAIATRDRREDDGQHPYGTRRCASPAG